MTLREISGEYRVSARLLRDRLRTLRAQRRACHDEDERFRLQRRIFALQEALGQVNELAELTEHYYERGYHRNEKYHL